MVVARLVAGAVLALVVGVCQSDQPATGHVHTETEAMVSLLLYLPAYIAWIIGRNRYGQFTLK